VTIFMSSHLLDEVEHLADRVSIVHAGRLVEEVNYKELALVEVSRLGDTGLRISDRAAKPALIARALVGAGVALERLAPMEEDLERHFMRLTGGES
jgi:ABC-type multidrug transport system ATPase subunit